MPMHEGYAALCRRGAAPVRGVVRDPRAAAHHPPPGPGRDGARAASWLHGPGHSRAPPAVPGPVPARAAGRRRRRGSGHRNPRDLPALRNRHPGAQRPVGQRARGRPALPGTACGRDRGTGGGGLAGISGPEPRQCPVEPCSSRGLERLGRDLATFARLRPDAPHLALEAHSYAATLAAQVLDSESGCAVRAQALATIGSAGIPRHLSREPGQAQRAGSTHLRGHRAGGPPGAARADALRQEAACRPPVQRRRQARSWACRRPPGTTPRSSAPGTRPRRAATATRAPCACATWR